MMTKYGLTSVVLAATALAALGGCASDVPYNEVPQSACFSREKDPDEVKVRSELPLGHIERIPGGEEMGLMGNKTTNKNKQKAEAESTPPNWSPAYQTPLTDEPAPLQ